MNMQAKQKQKQDQDRKTTKNNENKRCKSKPSTRPEILQSHILQLNRHIHSPRHQAILAAREHVRGWSEVMLRQHVPSLDIFPVFKAAVPEVPGDM
jgi:hypothetical protein